MNGSIITPGLSKDNFEDSKLLHQVNAIFKKKRGYTFRLPKPGGAVVLLISGGLDSICLWNILMSKYRLNVFPVHFLNPGNLVKKGEEESIGYYSNVFAALYPELFHKVEIIKAFSTNRTNSINSQDIKNDASLILNNLMLNKATGNYKVMLAYQSNPLYNYFFNAYVYAQKLKSSAAPDLHTILTAFVPEDASLARNSTLTVLRTVNLSLCAILGDFSWQFSGAFEKDNHFYLSKKTLIQYATRKKINLGRTWSCISRKTTQCGKCGPCSIRRNAFKKLRMVDPTTYVNLPIASGDWRRKFKSKVLNFTNSINDLFIKKTPITDKASLQNLAFFLSPDVIWQENDGRVQILHKRKGEVDELNESGSLLWKALAQKQQSFDSLLKLIKKNYAVDDLRLKKDLKQFLKHYTSEGYIYYKTIK